MTKTLSAFAFLILAAGFIFSSAALKKNGSISSEVRQQEDGFVVMELFTSQGCSSCPPADALLGTYAMKDDPRIIPLAFHVDYWNRLGWKDSFSNSRFSERQHDYASNFNLESVYTPQLIINGKKETVGNDAGKIARLVTEELRKKKSVGIRVSHTAINGNRLVLGYSISENLPHAVINAALVQVKADTQVKAGENKGIKLSNYNVVRDFSSVPISGTEGTLILQIPEGGSKTGLMCILYIQEKNNGYILGAVKTGL